MRQTLEQELYNSVEKNTPDYIKNYKYIDIENKGEFVFTLKKEHLLPYDANTNPEGLNLDNWLKNYEKEAAVSTAGIRGPQNILYPYDVRFPINIMGIMLATYAKALVAKEKYAGKKLLKLAGREVRYNSDKFLDLIARVQAAQGIETITTYERKTMPIWLASFLAFKLDLLGGEYITSSHGISVKNATKDLNSQGSQYLPEESMEFVNKIKEIFDIVRNNGSYDIKIAKSDDELINENFMKTINNGIDLYKEYLENGVANKENIELIHKLNNKIVIENVGGSAYNTLSKILDAFNISEKFVWMNTEEDPFFHGIGKYDTDPKGNKCFYDYSVDATVVAKKQDGSTYFPVIDTLNYSEKLKQYPTGTVVLITDPDHDRLTVCQIEEKSALDFLHKTGVSYSELDNNRILCVYTANQSFLLIMNFWAEQLKASNRWNNHPRFMIKTTASAKAWDEWAKFNGVKVVNVPVGFKEIANVMKKVEKQIIDNPDKDVVVTDVFGREVNLGKNPRMIFGGEESGGMIIGSEEIIKSKAGRIAIAMREKSASEAIIIASALAANLELHNKTLSVALDEIFNKNEIIAKYDIREDIAYYNESEPDIEKLTQAKKDGEAKRTKNDLFYLTMALSEFYGKITLEQVKSILKSTFKTLNFDNLTDIKFVGDGTFLQFTDKFIEIRPSGTDAKTKAYGAGSSKEDIAEFAKILGNYSGDLNDEYLAIIPKDYYNIAKEKSMEEYLKFTNKDADTRIFEIPDYKQTIGV
jgi:phosphomannomutase